MKGPDCVCVLGGGPAGAVAARRLAELGHRVVLVSRPGALRHPMAESVPPSVLHLLGSLGLVQSAELAAQRLEKGGLVLWDTPEPVRRPGEALLLDRRRLDRMLRAAAVDVGVRLVAAGGAPRRAADGGWRIRIGDGEPDVVADFLVDARGRRGGRRLGPMTAALVGVCEAGMHPDGSRVEAFLDGWAWGCPLPAGRYAVSCFTDAARLAGLDAAARTALWRALLAGTRLLAGLAKAPMLAPPRVVDATASVAARLAGPGFIAIGDAAVATEPLSSQGIQGALVSAVQGAAVVHTALTRPEDAELALGFHRAAREGAARRAQRQAAAFHASALDRLGSPFWQARQAPRRAPPAPAAPATSALRPAPGLRLQDTAVLDGALIRRGRAVSHPDLDAPVAFLGGVALAPLLDAARFPVREPDLLAAWSAQVGPAAAGSVLGWMRSTGLLVAP